MRGDALDLCNKKHKLRKARSLQLESVPCTRFYAVTKTWDGPTWSGLPGHMVPIKVPPPEKQVFRDNSPKITSISIRFLPALQSYHLSEDKTARDTCRNPSRTPWTLFFTSEVPSSGALWQRSIYGDIRITVFPKDCTEEMLRSAWQYVKRYVPAGINLPF